MTRTRRVRLYVATSLDGFIARPDGSVDWLFHGGDYGFSEFYKSVDTVFLGRRTHDFGIEHGSSSFAGKKNFVFSRSRSSDERGDVEYVSGDPRPLVERLQDEPGLDLWLVGGGELAAAFFEEDLVDDVIVAVHPVILGEGIPLVTSPRVHVDLKLLKTEQFPDGLVQLFYEVVTTTH